MTGPDDLPISPFESPEAWESWLRDHHPTSPGVWIQIAKQASGVPSVTYGEAVEAALCFGWIDGQRRALDERFFLQRFTPRRPKSIWSKINVAKVAALIDAGRMQPAGLREVEAARADGRFAAAYDSHSTSTVPDDFAAALAARPEAKAFFEGMTKANRFAMCYRIATAKRPETRRANIAKFIEMLQRGEMLYPDR